MDGGYPGFSSTVSQVQHYQLLEQLQGVVQKLDIKTQQRLPFDLLANLASSLRDSAIFTIVNDLEEIQHLTEKNLFVQRQKICAEQKGLRQGMKKAHTEAMQSCKSHNAALLKAQHEKESTALEKRLENELKQFDAKLLLEIDQKVIVQQATLKSAGVPGFYVTKDEQEVKLQMVLLHLIKTIGNSRQNMG